MYILNNERHLEGVGTQWGEDMVTHTCGPLLVHVIKLASNCLIELESVCHSASWSMSGWGEKPFLSGGEAKCPHCPPPP